MQDWKYFSGHFYYFSRDKKSWHEAENFCVSQGAHLASVTSQAEQVRAEGLGQAESGVWLGAQNLLAFVLLMGGRVPHAPIRQGTNIY